MKVSEQYTFDDYYYVVLDNVSKKLMTKEIQVNTKEELYELIFDFYFHDLPPNKAVIFLESFYSKYKKFLNIGIGNLY